MSVITGLKNIKKSIDRPSSGDGVKATWLKVEDGKSVKIRFINEIDPDSKNYNADRGLAIVVAEHTNPKDYRRKAICSMDDEGRCYGCEQNRKQPKEGWRARLRLYTNVLVNDGESVYTAIWSQSVGPKSTTTNTLIEYAEDMGSVSNLVWRLKRTGTGTSTNYTLIPLQTDDSDFDWTGVEVFDLERAAVRQVPYGEQEAFFMGLEVDESTSSNSEW